MTLSISDNCEFQIEEICKVDALPRKWPKSLSLFIWVYLLSVAPNRQQISITNTLLWSTGWACVVQTKPEIVCLQCLQPTGVKLSHILQLNAPLLKTKLRTWNVFVTWSCRWIEGNISNIPKWNPDGYDSAVTVFIPKTPRVQDLVETGYLCFEANKFQILGTEFTLGGFD